MNYDKINELIENAIQSGYMGMNGTPNFNRDQSQIFKYMVKNMQKRTLGMFEYKNLPETLSARSIELYLQGSGTCLIARVEKEDMATKDENAKPGIYALPCKAGGILNAYYLPTTAIVTNPYLGISKEYNIEKGEAVYMWNDSLLEGLAPMFSLYASELTDNVSTLHFQEVHSRILTIINACSEDERKDALEFLRDYEDGKFAALMNEDFIQNLKKNRVDPFKGSQQSSIKDTLEARQWLLAHWNIELGLNDNYNMKRESLNENEIEANADTLTPLLDDMYKCRKKGIEEINRIFGLNVEIDFSSSWKRVHEREKNAQKAEDLEIEAQERALEEPAPEQEPKKEEEIEK